MNIKPYFNIIVRKLWIIVLVPLLAAIITAYVSFNFVEPVYESSMTLFALNKNSETGPAYDDILASQQLIKDCRELIKSRSLMEDVIEQLNIDDLTVGDLARMITVSLKNDTRILEIKVRDTNNVRVKEITDRVGMLFKKKVNDLKLLETLDVVDKAEIPHKPVLPRPLVYTFIMSLISLFLVLCSVFMLEYLDDTFKNSEDVEKYLGLKVIATIPSLNMK